MFDIGSLTTFCTSNFAQKFIDIGSMHDIEKFIKSLSENKDFFCFGGGSNLLFSQNEYQDILFVKNSFGFINKLTDDRYLVSAGESLGGFINYIGKEGSNLMNPLFGLPGTIGGAVIGNAGSYGLEIGKFVNSVKFIDDKGNYIEDFKYEYGYRTSNLKGKKILLLEIELCVPKVFNPEILDKKEYVAKRLATQEYKNTCGSYFKNPKISETHIDFSKIYSNLVEIDKTLFENQFGKTEISVPAGLLIEKVGMKGFEYNGVKISTKHANFFVNYANKNSQNILDLASIVKEKVYAKFGINLEEEVIII